MSENGFFRFVYKYTLTRLMIRPFVSPWFSKLSGKLLSSRLSTCLIPGFIRKNQIDMSDFPNERYDSFNAFFTRRILNGARTVSLAERDLISPCDGELCAFPVTGDFHFEVKNSTYDLNHFTGSAELGKKYENGICLVIRLCPKDYHRYHFIDSGTLSESRYIPGVFHTVRPKAAGLGRVFKENTRVVTMLHTDHFGDVCQVEVGALLVGKIVNEGIRAFRRGQEKGHFEYGGSTIVLLFEKDSVRIKSEYFKATDRGIETRVRMGEVIGEKTDNFP